MARATEIRGYWPVTDFVGSVTSAAVVYDRHARRWRCAFTLRTGSREMPFRCYPRDAQDARGWRRLLSAPDLLAIQTDLETGEILQARTREAAVRYKRAILRAINRDGGIRTWMY